MKESHSDNPTKGAWLSASDVQQKELRVSRFGGYKMRDVDEFLDEITDSLSALVAEIDRLRSRPAGEGMVGVPDLEDVGRQADEIIQRARAEAARIVADARLGSAAPTASGGGSPPVVDRAAIGGFLTQERTFLESLARLVQDHAETMKAMAKVARGRASASSGVAVSVGEAKKAQPPADTPTVSKETPAEETSHADGSADVPVVEDRQEEEPVRLEEPEPAAVAGHDRDDDSSAEGEGGSLRDLFWGDN
ncbi:MAG: DivIVA domain-containing protein [Actinomycetota bacterium]|nr:DivIVA domain-containing protein [Actinomycetota bacterium]